MSYRLQRELGGVEVVGGEAQVHEDGLVVDELLHNEAGCGQHGQAAVVELLGRQGVELGLVGRLEAEGVKACVLIDKRAIGKRNVE